jgi:hypothetical protein
VWAPKKNVIAPEAYNETTKITPRTYMVLLVSDIKLVSKNGEFTYSNIYLANYNVDGRPKFYIAVNSNGNPESLIGILEKNNQNGQGVLVIYNGMGQIIKEEYVQLSAGINTIEIPKNSLPKFSVGIVSLYIGNQLAFCQKASF